MKNTIKIICTSLGLIYCSEGEITSFYLDNGLKTKARFTITPGSEQVRYTIERDGFIRIFKQLGADVFANACGPCIGQWARAGSEKEEKNTIVHSFNRNFSKRADGNPNTHAFVASPELVTALAISGDLTFDPTRDSLTNSNGDPIILDPPQGFDLPQNGFAVEDLGYQVPASEDSSIDVKVDSNSKRLQLLMPFEPWNGKNIAGMRLLIKTKGKCTTDHISMAGPWLRFRGHLDNISDNMLTGAVNYFNDSTNSVKNQLTGDYGPVPEIQRAYKAAGIPTLVVGDENYGEGSSREHAAMEPRFMNIKAVIVKSFARIHETNLKKQGILALTFHDKEDYNMSRDAGLLTITGPDLHKIGIEKAIEIVKERTGDGPAYLTFDIDFVDPAYAPGTGTPEAGGFTGHDSISFVRGLTGINFVGFDMVEVMPGYDPAQVTSLLAANIIYEFITLIALSKKYHEQ